MIHPSLILSLFASSSATFQDGYKISNDTIEFLYSGSGSLKNVYVSANFNNWTKDNEAWKMKYDTNAKRWKLNKSISAIRSYGSFLEFGFLVEGKLLDADRSAKNIIYCEGYGYRYVIK
ncbi:hypothetical protein [Niastella sp. OAS944]|uniref:hypothetical protein n=1 Tax=Niastella sp. OAS944 TaxID=2664089 RepID=UPI0034829878|nr:hypothetical protein [Chitinophagaceae bacterium OAS944]